MVGAKAPVLLSVLVCMLKLHDTPDYAIRQLHLQSQPARLATQPVALHLHALCCVYACNPKQTQNKS